MSEAEVMHLGGQSSAQAPVERSEAASRAFLYFFQKHYGLTRSLAVRFLIFSGSVVRIFLWTAVLLSRHRHKEAKNRLRGYLRILVAAVTGPLRHERQSR